MKVKRFFPVTAFSPNTWTSLFVSLVHQETTNALLRDAVQPLHHKSGAWRTLVRSDSSISIPWHHSPQSAGLHPFQHVRTLHSQTSYRSSRRFLSPSSRDDVVFKPGDPIQVEVISFGPLGASVSVVGLGHAVELLPVDAEAYGCGLILQQEIAYFREARDHVDVVRGEILAAYVQNVRPEDGKLDIGLRAFGGKAKADQIYEQILKKLEASPDGTLPVGDKSTPVEISYEFPGVSKSVFKKAVGALYKKGLLTPLPNSISLTKK
jgi:CvfB-like winged helix domain